MIECNFSRSESSKSIRLSGSEFKTVIETFHDAAGNSLPGPKPIEQKFPVRAQHARHFLHGPDARTHHAIAPEIEKLSSPKGRDIVPEELEVFLQQIAAHRFQVVAQQVGEFDFLVRSQILRPLKQAPTGMGQDWGQSSCLQFSGLLRTNFVNGLVHMHDDMEAVQDMDGLAGLPGDNLEVRLPHVTADKKQLSGSLFAESPEKPQESSDGSILADPQQAFASSVDLINHGEIFVPSLPEHFINADGSHIGQVPMSQAPFDRPFHGSEHLLPGRAKSEGGFFPGESLSPGSQKMHVGFRQSVFAVGPGHALDFHATVRTIDPAQGIGEKNRDVPQRYEFKHSRRQGVVARAGLPAAGTDGFAVGARQNLDQDRQMVCFGIQPHDVSVDKALELLHPIQNSLQLHPGRFLLYGLLLAKKPIQDSVRMRYVIFLFSLLREITRRACGKVEKSRRFLAGLFHFSTGLHVTCFYPQILLKTQNDKANAGKTARPG
jgi:hypothetical protein